MRHPSPILVPFLVALVLTVPAAFAADVTDEEVAAVARRFAAEIDCAPESRNLHRAWCAVTMLEKAAWSAPEARTAYLGLAMELKDGGKVIEGLLRTTHTAVLSVSSKDAKVTTIRASKGKPDEEQELARVVFDLALVLKGKEKARAIEASAGLVRYVASLASRPGYPVRAAPKGGAHYTGKLPARLLKVTGLPYGEAYVAIEKAEGGWFVSLFPVAQVKVRAEPPKEPGK